MYTTTDNVYETVYHIVQTSGNNHNQKDFSVGILQSFASACPFDQARIYFYNRNGKVSEQYLMGVDKKWATAYHEYYSKILDGRYSLRTDTNESFLSPTQKPSKKNWTNVSSDEFINDYIRPQNLKYTLGFSFFDTEGSLKVQFMLDRTTNLNYSSQETEIVRLSYPLLNNLHKNFFSNSSNANKLDQVNWNTTDLTPREIDVTTLLCQGVSPANISKKLHIAQPTVNKHIAHIYAKLHVSNRQELLVRILNA